MAQKQIELLRRDECQPLTQEQIEDIKSQFHPQADGSNVNITPYHIYDEDEHVVGEWIDGKPLYEKTFTGTMGSTASSGKTIDISSINYDVAFFSNAYIGWRDGSNSGYISLLARAITDSYSLSCFTQNSSIIILCSGIDSRLFNNMPYYITVQYTKTTD